MLMGVKRIRGTVSAVPDGAKCHCYHAMSDGVIPTAGYPSTFDLLFSQNCGSDGAFGPDGALHPSGVNIRTPEI